MIIDNIPAEYLQVSGNENYAPPEAYETIGLLAAASAAKTQVDKSVGPLAWLESGPPAVHQLIPEGSLPLGAGFQPRIASPHHSGVSEQFLNNHPEFPYWSDYSFMFTMITMQQLLR